MSRQSDVQQRRQDGARPQAAPADRPARIPRLIAGTMVSTDLVAARDFYENFLGLDCVAPAPGRLLLRDQHSRAAMEAGDEDFFVIEVSRVDAIAHPQKLLNHWGIDVPTTQEVERIHGEAKRLRQRFGLARVKEITSIHASYGFYLADRDINWWEIERRVHGLDNHGYFARGDMVDDPGVAPNPLADEVRRPRPQPAGRPDSVVGSGELTHGTCEQVDLPRARKFLIGVLGLRSVRHAPPAQMLAGRNDVAVVAVAIGKPAMQSPDNRWLIDVGDERELAATRRRAIAARDECGISAIGDIEHGEAGASFAIHDGDGNWWQVAAMAPDHYPALFARGDIGQAATTAGGRE